MNSGKHYFWHTNTKMWKLSFKTISGVLWELCDCLPLNVCYSVNGNSDELILISTHPYSQTKAINKEMTSVWFIGSWIWDVYLSSIYFNNIFNLTIVFTINNFYWFLYRCPLKLIYYWKVLFIKNKQSSILIKIYYSSLTI